MKKIFALVLTAALALSLAACGAKKEEKTVLKVAATPVPHAEILEALKEDLAAQGIELQVTVYNDYVIPNTAAEEGEEDANFFQHVPYLDDFNAERGTHLVSVAGVHVEPMGLYGGKSTSLDSIPDGATVAVPNDVTNEARALLLLQSQGILKLKDDAGLEATPKDIADNPHNLKFVEVEAAQLTKTLSEVDYAIINSNYALDAGLNPVNDSLAIESGDSPYVNVLVVKEGNENNAAVQALVKALTSDKCRSFIEEKYAGSVVPAF